MDKEKKGENTLHCEIDYLWQALGKAQDDSAVAGRACADAAKELYESRSRTSGLENSVREYRSREKQLKEEIEKLKSRWASGEKTVEEARNLAKASRRAWEKIEKLALQLSNNENMVGLLKDEISALKAEITQAQNSALEKDSLIEALRAEIKGLLSLKDIGGVIEKATADGKNGGFFEKMLAGFELEKTKNRKISEDAAGLHVRIAELKERISALENEKTLLSRALDDKKNRLEKQGSALDKISRDLKAAAENSAKTGKENDALKKICAKMKEELREAAFIRRDFAATQGEKDRENLELRLELHNARAKTEEERKNFTDISGQIGSLKLKLRDSERQAEENTQQLRKLEETMARRKNELERLNALLKRSSSSLIEEKERNRKLRSENDKLRNNSRQK